MCSPTPGLLFRLTLSFGVLACGSGSVRSERTAAGVGAPDTSDTSDVPPFVRATLTHPGFTWETAETTHFHVRAPARSYPAARLDSVAQAIEGARGQVRTRLGLAGVDDTGAVRARVFVVETGDDMRALVGQPAGGWTEPAANAVLLRMSVDEAPPIRHELGHLYSHRAWGRPRAAWISEGVALFAVGHCAGRPLHTWAAAVRAAELQTSLAELQQKFDFTRAAPHLEAGSFVTFVHDRYGLAAIRALWSGGLEALPSAVGARLDELESAWRGEIGRHTAEARSLDPRGRVRCETGGAA